MQLSEFYRLYEKSGIGNGAKSMREILTAVDLLILEQERPKMGWEAATPQARQWWSAFEEANKQDLFTVRELVQELARRGVTVDDFFGIFVHTGAQTMTDLLKEVDELVNARKMHSSITAFMAGGAASATA